MNRNSRRDGLFRVVSGAPNILSFVAVALLITGGVYFLWSRFGGPVVNDPKYLLTLDAIELKAANAGDFPAPEVGQPAALPKLADRPSLEQPPWISPDRDIKAEVFRDGSLDKLSILHPNVVEFVGEAFLMHTWVARVALVQKVYPSKVYVVMEYRRPTALVEVDHENTAKLQPVDALGHVLPTDFLKEGRARVGDFPRIVIDRRMPQGPEGAAWGDPRVAEAARVADLTRSLWKELHLYRIRAVPSPYRSELSAYILTDSGGQPKVVWGHQQTQDAEETAARNNETPLAPGEATADRKLAGLRAAFEKYGPLDGPQWPGIIDLRNPEEVLIAPGTPAQPASTSGSISGSTL